MSNSNSLIPFATQRAEDLFNTIGIIQFTSEFDWYQVTAGLILQGGFLDNVTTGTTVPFIASLPKQVLFIGIQPIAGAAISTALSAVTLDDFVLNHNSGGASDFYWYAIGV